jgi:hypothetical protein
LSVTVTVCVTEPAIKVSVPVHVAPAVIPA